MAKYTLKGTCKWAKVFNPDPEYGTYQIQLYPDKKSLKTIVESGCQGKPKEDEDGTYYTFRRKPQVLSRKGELIDFGPPKVRDIDGKPMTDLIGNGSSVEIEITTYNTNKGIGTKFESVKVLKLVPYERKEIAA